MDYQPKLCFYFQNNINKGLLLNTTKLIENRVTISMNNEKCKNYKDAYEKMTEGFGSKNT
ncbi:hypothetical protein DY102_03775 [Apilactobacillus timberlakei]|nr:hypothetical protein DY102_03775 [Apilactobacillus timberlakei]